MSKERKIAYEEHPVSAERKAELIAGGFRILDIVFQPEEDRQAAQEEEAPAKRKKAE